MLFLNIKCIENITLNHSYHLTIIVLLWLLVVLCFYPTIR